MSNNRRHSNQCLELDQDIYAATAAEFVVQRAAPDTKIFFWLQREKNNCMQNNLQFPFALGQTYSVRNVAIMH